MQLYRAVFGNRPLPSDMWQHLSPQALCPPRVTKKDTGAQVIFEPEWKAAAQVHGVAMSEIFRLRGLKGSTDKIENPAGGVNYMNLSITVSAAFLLPVGLGINLLVES